MWWPYYAGIYSATATYGSGLTDPLTRRPNLRRFRASSLIWTASCGAKSNRGGFFLKNHPPRPPNGLKSRLPCPTNDYFGQQCFLVNLRKLPVWVNRDLSATI